MLSCCVLGKASVILSLSHQHTTEMLSLPKMSVLLSTYVLLSRIM